MYQQHPPLKIDPHLIDQAMQKVVDGANPNACLCDLVNMQGLGFERHNERSWSMLHVMMRMGHLDHVRTLLQLGANPLIAPTQRINMIALAISSYPLVYAAAYEQYHESIMSCIPSFMEYEEQLKQIHQRTQSTIINLVQKLLDRGVLCDPAALRQQHLSLPGNLLHTLDEQDPFMALYDAHQVCPIADPMPICHVLADHGADPSPTMKRIAQSRPIGLNLPLLTALEQAQAIVQRRLLTHAVKPSSCAAALGRKM